MSNNQELRMIDRFIILNLLYLFNGDYNAQYKYMPFNINHVNEIVEMLNTNDKLITIEDEIIAKINFEYINGIMRYYLENKLEIINEINKIIQNNDLLNLGAIKSNILIASYIEIKFFSQNIKFLVTEYLYIADIYGMSKNELNFINKIVDNIYLQK